MVIYINTFCDFTHCCFVQVSLETTKYKYNNSVSGYKWTAAIGSRSRVSDQEKPTPYIPPGRLQLSTNQNAGKIRKIILQIYTPGVTSLFSDHIRTSTFFQRII